jgi:ribosome recycling factor
MCNLSNFQYTMEEISMILDMVKQEMDAALKHLDHAFQKLEQVERLLLWCRM